jgi:hypothetical protein
MKATATNCRIFLKVWLGSARWTAINRVFRRRHCRDETLFAALTLA